MRPLHRIAKSSLAAAALMLGVAGCTKDPLTGPRNAMEDARNRWESRKLDDYSFLYQHQCFCHPDILRPAIVIVRHDTIAEVLFADNRQPVPRESLPVYNTIDGLFTVLQDAIARKADHLEVTYDATLGYPKKAWIDYQENTADEELGFTVDSVQALP